MFKEEEMRVKKRECGWIHLSLTYLTFACIILMILALISLRHPPLCLKLCVIKGMRTNELCITNRISQNVFRSDQTLRKNEERGIWMRYCFDTFLRTKTPRKMLPRSFLKSGIEYRYMLILSTLFGEPDDFWHVTLSWTVPLERRRDC